MVSGTPTWENTDRRLVDDGFTLVIDDQLDVPTHLNSSEIAETVRTRVYASNQDTFVVLSGRDDATGPIEGRAVCPRYGKFSGPGDCWMASYDPREIVSRDNHDNKQTINDLLNGRHALNNGRHALTAWTDGFSTKREAQALAHIRAGSREDFNQLPENYRQAFSSPLADEQALGLDRLRRLDPDHQAQFMANGSVSPEPTRVLRDLRYDLDETREYKTGVDRVTGHGYKFVAWQLSAYFDGGFNVTPKNVAEFSNVLNRLSQHEALPPALRRRLSANLEDLQKAAVATTANEIADIRAATNEPRAYLRTAIRGYMNERLAQAHQNTLKTPAIGDGQAANRRYERKTAMKRGAQAVAEETGASYDNPGPQVIHDIARFVNAYGHIPAFDSEPLGEAVTSFKSWVQATGIDKTSNSAPDIETPYPELMRLEAHAEAARLRNRLQSAGWSMTPHILSRPRSIMMVANFGDMSRMRLGECVIRTENGVRNEASSDPLKRTNAKSAAAFPSHDSDFRYVRASDYQSGDIQDIAYNRRSHDASFRGSHVCIVDRATGQIDNDPDLGPALVKKDGTAYAAQQGQIWPYNSARDEVSQEMEVQESDQPKPGI